MQALTDMLDDSLFGARAVHTHAFCVGVVAKSRREARRRPSGRRL